VRNGKLSLADFLYFSFYPEDGGDTFSETSVNTTYTRCQIPEDYLLHSNRRESLKFYKASKQLNAKQSKQATQSNQASKANHASKQSSEKLADK
jgi:hypothetical protein